MTLHITSEELCTLTDIVESYSHPKPSENLAESLIDQTDNKKVDLFDPYECPTPIPLHTFQKSFYETKNPVVESDLSVRYGKGSQTFIRRAVRTLRQFAKWVDQKDIPKLRAMVLRFSSTIIASLYSPFSIIEEFKKTPPLLMKSDEDRAVIGLIRFHVRRLLDCLERGESFHHQTGHREKMKLLIGISSDLAIIDLIHSEVLNRMRRGNGQPPIAILSVISELFASLINSAVELMNMKQSVGVVRSVVLARWDSQEISCDENIFPSLQIINELPSWVLGTALEFSILQYSILSAWWRRTPNEFHSLEGQSISFCSSSTPALLKQMESLLTCLWKRRVASNVRSDRWLKLYCNGLGLLCEGLSLNWDVRRGPDVPKCDIPKKKDLKGSFNVKLILDFLSSFDSRLTDGKERLILESIWDNLTFEDVKLAHNFSISDFYYHLQDASQTSLTIMESCQRFVIILMEDILDYPSSGSLTVHSIHKVYDDILMWLLKFVEVENVLGPESINILRSYLQ